MLILQWWCAGDTAAIPPAGWAGISFEHKLERGGVWAIRMREKIGKDTWAFRCEVAYASRGDVAWVTEVVFEGGNDQPIAASIRQVRYPDMNDDVKAG